MMHIDLQRDSRRVFKNIKQRVKDYPVYVNAGPGEDEDSISLITLGFSFDQSGWFALVFDTRPDAQPDGHWQDHIEETAVPMSHWCDELERFADDCEEGGQVKPLKIKLHDGTTKMLTDCDVEEVAGLFGSMLKDALVRADEDGLFSPLPLTMGYGLVVEDHDLCYGWWNQEPTGPGSESDYLAQLEGDVAGKPVEAQIDHWIKVLERVARGKETESDWSFRASGHAIKRLEELGDRAIVPVLKFVRKWANKPEFEGDRPKSSRNIKELPMHGPTTDALYMVRRSECRTPEVESLLREIVRRSVKVNTARKLWGIIPVWAATCLTHLFDGYPEPEQHPSTNELVNREKFTKRRRVT